MTDGFEEKWHATPREIPKMVEATALPALVKRATPRSVVRTILGEALVVPPRESLWRDVVLHELAERPRRELLCDDDDIRRPLGRRCVERWMSFALEVR